jgi:radical SAM superfamily enzyme YgiQ (UPF0313 family)
MSLRVLLIYPNYFGMNMLPSSMALLSAVLKKEGHQVELFDTTYYYEDAFGTSDSDGTKVERLAVLPFDDKLHMKQTDWRDDIRDTVKTFQPDLIGMSTTEDMWDLGVAIIEQIEDYIVGNAVPVVTGGVFSTFAPEIAIKHPLVNMVCVGEGENALRTLCERIEKRQSFSDVTNLWVKNADGSITKNPISDPVDVNAMPRMDITLFDEQRMMRPMAGKWYKMLPMETIRGCPYKCAYCNSPNQMDLYNEATPDASYFRKKRIDRVYQELKYFKDEIGVQYNYFWADTFLAISDREFEEFCDMYSDIKLPFWMQTRPETLTDYKIKKLKAVGLHRFNVGIEHGNDEFRRRILRRSWKNEDIIEAMKIPLRHGVQFTTNNICGFPTETRELAMETIELNRHIESNSQNMFAFVPFHGIPLRKMSEDLGLVEVGKITKCVTEEPQINMPQFPREEVLGLTKCFVLYVKFPKNRWNEIRQAEKETPEGRKILAELREECKEKYFSKKQELDSSEDPSVPDLEYGLEYPTSPHP